MTNLSQETGNQILRTLGRIEGELVEIRKLTERVSRLEQWHAWFKGAWAVLAAVCAWLVGSAQAN